MSFNIKNNPNDDCVVTKKMYMLFTSIALCRLFWNLMLKFFFENNSRICQKSMILIKELHYFVSKILSLKILINSCMLGKYKNLD